MRGGDDQHSHFRNHTHASLCGMSPTKPVELKTICLPKCNVIRALPCIFSRWVRQRTDQRTLLRLLSGINFGDTMKNAVELRSVMTKKRLGCFAESNDQSCASPIAQERLQNNRFVSLLNACRRSGGLARASEVAARFKRQGQYDLSPLAGWLVRREVISIEWQANLWLPLFQFQPTAMALRPGLSPVLAELVVVYNDWDVATWFTLPNPWLANAAPADALAAGAAQVLDAARAERFSQA